MPLGDLPRESGELLESSVLEFLFSKMERKFLTAEEERCSEEGIAAAVASKRSVKVHACTSKLSKGV